MWGGNRDVFLLNVLDLSAWYFFIKSFTHSYILPQPPSVTAVYVKFKPSILTLVFTSVKNIFWGKWERTPWCHAWMKWCWMKCWMLNVSFLNFNIFETTCLIWTVLDKILHPLQLWFLLVFKSGARGQTFLFQAFYIKPELHSYIHTVIVPHIYPKHFKDLAQLVF